MYSRYHVSLNLVLETVTYPQHCWGKPTVFFANRIQINCRFSAFLATLVHRCFIGHVPEYLAEFYNPSFDRRPEMGSAGWQWEAARIPHTQTSFGDRSFAFAGPCTWNNLPDAIRDLDLSPTFSSFTKLLKCYLFVYCSGPCEVVIFNGRQRNVGY